MLGNNEVIGKSDIDMRLSRVFLFRSNFKKEGSFCLVCSEVINIIERSMTMRVEVDEYMDIERRETVKAEARKLISGKCG